MGRVGADWRIWRRISLARSVICIVFFGVVVGSGSNMNECTDNGGYWSAPFFGFSISYFLFSLSKRQHFFASANRRAIPLQSTLYATVAKTVSCSLSYTPPPKRSLRGSTRVHPFVGAIKRVRCIV